MALVLHLTTLLLVVMRGLFRLLTVVIPRTHILGLYQHHGIHLLIKPHETHLGTACKQYG